MSRGISSAIARNGGRSADPSTEMRSPPRSFSEAFAARSFTKTFSSEISCCTRARLTSRCPTRSWSRRLPASSATTEIRTGYASAIRREEYYRRLRNCGKHTNSAATWKKVHAKHYRVALMVCAGIDFDPGRNHQISPPANTNPIAINCVPVIAPPKTDPRPGSSRKYSKKNLAIP